MNDFKRQLMLALLGYGVNRNIDPQKLCEASGVNYTFLTDTNNDSVTSAQINNIWKNASFLSGDELFGLHFGESMQLAALGVVGQIIHTSNTVGEALAHACTMTHLVTDMFEMHIKRGRTSFKIVLTHDDAKKAQYPDAFRHMADYLMVFIVHELRGLVLQQIKPIAVKFPKTADDTIEYTRVFGCVPRQANELSVEFENTLLNQNILSSNYELQSYLLKQVGMLTRTDGTRSLQTKIYNYLLGNSYLQQLTLEAVASNFNLSVRSLQRKLKDEQTTYQEILEQVRKTIAISYISSGNYAVKDISHLLGYNEQSAFLRAFKRWTGMTPKSFTIKKQLGSSSRRAS